MEKFNLEKHLKAFNREALEELNLIAVNYMPITKPLRLREQTGIGIRYCFVCKDYIERVVLNPEKYRKYEWVDKAGIMLPRIPAGTRKVLAHVGYLT